VLRVLDLYGQRDQRVSSLSTGMRQKINLIRALVPEPEVLFLDEPTVGLDVSAARDIRAYIGEWLKVMPGRTIVLTTHYLQEAEELCDRVAIIHQGEIIACDAPAVLRRSTQEGSAFVLTTAALDEADWLRHIPGVRQAAIEQRDGRSELRVQLEDDAAITALVGALAEHDRKIFALQKIEPSLEDAFVRLVGRRMGELDEPEGAR
jgi:ABC-2 type transport system ATP-binding protein